MRAIVLFNPDTPGLSIDVTNHVETLREKVYATLEEHCRTRHEKDTSRYVNNTGSSMASLFAYVLVNFESGYGFEHVPKVIAFVLDIFCSNDLSSLMTSKVRLFLTLSESFGITLRHCHG